VDSLVVWLGRGGIEAEGNWIPAFAGMTAVGVYERQR